MYTLTALKIEFNLYIHRQELQKNTTAVCSVIVNEEIFESTEALAVSGLVPCNRKTSLISCKTSPLNAMIKGSYPIH